MGKVDTLKWRCAQNIVPKLPLQVVICSVESNMARCVNLIIFVKTLLIFLFLFNGDWDNAAAVVLHVRVY